MLFRSAIPASLGGQLALCPSLSLSDTFSLVFAFGCDIARSDGAFLKQVSDAPYLSVSLPHLTSVSHSLALSVARTPPKRGPHFGSFCVCAVFFSLRRSKGGDYRAQVAHVGSRTV